MDNKIFRSMSYGVYVAGTMDGQRPTGCIVNSVMQITSQPATVAISVNHDNYTNGCIVQSGFFSFSILAEDSDPGLIGGFGFQSGRDTDKFAGVDYEMAAGCPVVKDSCGYVVCRVISTMETATHTVFLGEVVDGAIYEGSRKKTLLKKKNLWGKKKRITRKSKKKHSLRVSGNVRSAAMFMRAKNCRKTLSVPGANKVQRIL